VENNFPQISLGKSPLIGFLTDTARFAGRNAEQVWM
jgi:hypothetical protein